ncbi:SGNH/GDSL hydrolase family protein [Yinghuangia seranimata]|uniref:SGNH/GDSL hydrolase family protein n=1 Tax=Yinghuangia seranimata TaxID=408067 RepID=UPI00248C478B|nr:SGNH/GDSL hydrolase family protein [Yinghuangia seranimata]MDI2129248.1 GDSL-type esterase/lipase family protein [Yinghuangia seranimata]
MGKGRDGAGRSRRGMGGAAALAAALVAVAGCTSDSGTGPRAVSQAAAQEQNQAAGPVGQPSAGAAANGAVPGARPTSRAPAGTSAPAPAGQPSAKPTGPFPKPHSMAALGDSITRGFDACTMPLKDCPEKSWATGGDVDSQAKRLGLPSSAVFNDARTGARMTDLADQARAAVGQRVEYVTVLLGANDACRDDETTMTSVFDYERQLRAGLQILRDGLPGVHVMVVSVPDVGRLWEVAHGEQMARLVWSAGVCRSMLADPESGKPDVIARRQRVRDRVTAYNDVLRRVCGEWTGQCKYDGGVLNAHKFGKNDLSRWDWFHPSGQGQNVIADLTTRAGFRWQE